MGHEISGAPAGVETLDFLMARPGALREIGEVPQLPTAGNCGPPWSNLVVVECC